MLENIDFLGPIVIIVLSFYGLLFRKHILSKIISLDILNTGIISLFVIFSSKKGNFYPILTPGVSEYVDPFPQAVIITSIVIGFATLSLTLALSMMIVEAKRKTDLTKIEKE
ncbi:NADH-quinone oxidoreductase subunit K [Thermosipho atlanticus]|uniref:Multisubunit sodium/proton antiporter, MrpC subunit (TC 2.A.63.1) n=1 Tax=Thermosipho atlanticus DSM 15807 TaxID=1123380 RepID=A0A1M5T4X6_9BACT|nr:NADH-quinone oxidoreductase subunit K [Thermosipho atlanticus]SHH45784.1 multisubunit sodium/proton antiporter, MrpC subunit (TC 2.A.63.1) [Thermosipho atlanticus DSM 15807]